MRRLTVILAILLCAALLVPSGTALADAAIGGEYNYQEADFYVVVDAPDFYVNFRFGPGMEYGIKYPIYNGEILHVTATSDNYYDNLWWGQVEYNGDWGWISISQTTMIDPPYEQPETAAPVPAPEPVTTAPAPEPVAPETAPAGQEDQSAADVIHGVRNTGYLVEDAYYLENNNEYYSIPMINLDSEEIRELNRKIYQEIWPRIQESLASQMEVERLVESTYCWYINADTLSIVISNVYGGPWYEYSVYNISISEQRLLDPSEVVSLAGLTWEKYLQKAAERMEQCFHEKNDKNFSESSPDAQNQFDQLLAQTVDPENIAAAMPFLNGDGHLCILGQIYLYLAQLSYTWSVIDLVSDTPEAQAPQYVRVSAPEGTTFLRKSADPSGQSLLPIYNGQKLCITETMTDPQDSLEWGKTSYNEQQGWIRLDDTVYCHQ